MTLKTLERYRKMHAAPEGYPWVREMMDEVEREVDERYLELPVDEDGVPIRPGDELEYCSDDIIHMSGENLGNVSGREKVMFIAFDCDGYIAIQNEEDEELGSPLAFFRDYDCMHYRHVKPDELKELLEEFDKAARDIHTTSEFDELMDEYAERIRKAVGE